MTIHPLTFESTIASLKTDRKLALSKPRPRVVVLGAGPAGLLGAIVAIVNGCTTQIIEKRKEGAKGRENMVALQDKTLCILEKYGIYQSLKEEGLIYPLNREGYVCVQIKDLENAMKRVVKKLDSEVIFHYGTQVTEIVQKNLKADLILREKTVEEVDVIVNAEGCKSSTNDLLKIARVRVLPPIPVITTIFKDNRPRITGLKSGFEYMLKTAGNVATTCYHFTHFAFRALFFGERFSNPSRVISGGALLKTPGCNYLGFGFTKEGSDKVHHLINQKKNKELKAFIEKSIGLGFSSANAFAAMRRFYGAAGHFHMALWLPYDHFTITEIGADFSEKCSLRLNDSAFLIMGDALATVEPTTGLGCNLAIESSEVFKDFIEKWSVQKLDVLLKAYDKALKKKVVEAHSASISMRTFHRPDALHGASLKNKHPFEETDPDYLDPTFLFTLDMYYGKGNWYLPLPDSTIEEFNQTYGEGNWKIQNYEKGEYTLALIKKK